MSDDPEKTSPMAPSVDQDREAILARRSRFVAAALKGLAGASLVAVACLPESGCAETQPTLPDAGADAAPQPCLSPLAPQDAGRDAPVDSSGRDASDASPQPCLSPLPPDAASDASDASDQ